MRKLIVLCFVLGMGLATVTVLSFIRLERCVKDIETKTDEIRLLGLENSLLLEYSKLQYVYNEKYIFDTKLHDGMGNERNLSSLLDDEYKLLVKFSQYHCKSCVEHLLNELKIVPKDKVLIIGAFENKRTYLSFMKGLNTEFKTYFLNVKEDCMNILVDENLPYIGLLNNEMFIRDLFIPIKEIPSCTQRYLNVIVDKYFD